RQPQTVRIGGPIVVTERDSAERSMIREVFHDWRVEIAIGLRRRDAAAQRPPAPSVAGTNRSGGGREAASAEIGRPVKALLDVAGRRHLHDTPELAAVLGWEIAGHHVDALHVGI